MQIIVACSARAIVRDPRESGKVREIVRCQSQTILQKLTVFPVIHPLMSFQREVFVMNLWMSTKPSWPLPFESIFDSMSHDRKFGRLRRCRQILFALSPGPASADGHPADVASGAYSVHFDSRMATGHCCACRRGARGSPPSSPGALVCMRREIAGALVLFAMWCGRSRAQKHRAKGPRRRPLRRPGR